MIEKTRREYLIIRVMENSQIKPSGCREWTATKTKDGYGLIRFAMYLGGGWNSSQPAHRALYQAHYNVILERNQWVLHKCDNPSCVNIDHLFIGSSRDNTQDKLAKGRNAKYYKLHTRHRKFTDDQIKYIKQSIGPLKEIADLMKVSIGYVSKLRRGKAKTLIK